MKKVLLTGVAGFAGSHLAEHLISKNVAVFGIYHPRHSIENVKHLKKRISLFACNLLGESDLKSWVNSIKPDYVFHLAAFSSPAGSFENPQEILKNNILSELNLLESLMKLRSKAKILIIGSADEYGRVNPKFLPVDENTPLAPVSPYGVSKVAQDMLGFQYFTHYNLAVVRVRPFNHIGPRQSKNFVVSSFASQIANLEKRGGGEIKVGNLENHREFTDVRDMVKAYWLALEKCKFGDVYNIGNGVPVRIAEILKLMISFAKVKITIRKEKTRLVPADIKKIYCDSSKFRKLTGWKPKIPLRRTLFDTIEYERKKLRN